LEENLRSKWFELLIITAGANYLIIFMRNFPFDGAYTSPFEIWKHSSVVGWNKFQIGRHFMEITDIYQTFPVFNGQVTGTNICLIVGKFATYGR